MNIHIVPVLVSVFMEQTSLYPYKSSVNLDYCILFYQSVSVTMGNFSRFLKISNNLSFHLSMLKARG